jgi:hypothetical protein
MLGMVAPTIPVLRSPTLEDCKFKSNLDYIGRPRLTPQHPTKQTQIREFVLVHSIRAPSPRLGGPIALGRLGTCHVTVTKSMW